MARALVGAATHGLIHRDLKPANIMLTANPSGASELEVKVIDFGLARANAELDLTRGGFVGTPTFASPEQLARRTVDACSDLYSLGVTVWYALTGEVPYAGKTVEEMRAALAERPLPTERLAAHKVPAPVVQILRRMLATEPNDRPQSARELLAALEGCRRALRHRHRRRVWCGRDVGAPALDRHRPRVWAGTATLACGLLLVGFAITKRYSPSTAKPPPEKSIAVLPFVNLSDVKDNSYFTAGIQDELLANLSEIADLKVISRTSVMQYQPGAHNLREIGRALGVANIVEGSVQRRGDHVRVIAQLIDARTDTHLWGHTFDRNLSDTFTLEDDLAEEIARQLQARISPQEHSLIKENPTSDLTAYAFYNEAKNMQCPYCDAKIALLEKAISYDPNFILAYCYLAETEDYRYTNQYFASDPQREKTARRVRKLIDKAVQRRPDRGEPHLALAHHFFIAYQFAESRKELDIALPLLPNDSEAIFLDARLDRHSNRWDEALEKARHALALDPKNQFLAVWIGQTYLNSRRYDEGEKFLRQTIAQNPEAADKFNNTLATFRLNQGDLSGARALCVHPKDDDDVATQFSAAYYARDYRTAQKIAATAASDTARPWPQNYTGRESEARVYRVAGDAQKARQLFLAIRQADNSFSHLTGNEWYFSTAAEVDAALGRKDQAIHEALHAVDLHPLAAEPINGPVLARILALVYAWTGERDSAIAQLQILAKIPSTISYGELRFSPDWDALRGDPRFATLVASLQPKPVR